MSLRLRPYTPKDQPACLALFDSNTPLFFSPAERPDFEHFLQNLPGPFFVVESDGEIVGCGGYGRKGHNILLTWGMVRRDQHRHGIGTFLLQERLKHIAQETPQAHIQIHTSQHIQPFFARFGFRQTGFTPDAYAPGLHCVEMTLDLPLPQP